MSRVTFELQLCVLIAYQRPCTRGGEEIDREMVMGLHLTPSPIPENRIIVSYQNAQLRVQY